MTSHTSPHHSITEITADHCFHPPEFIQETLDDITAHKNVVLQGPTGTGKTWLAVRLARILAGERHHERTCCVAFFSGVTHENFILGIAHPLAADQPRSSPFLNIVQQANADPDNAYVLIIEEFNRGDPIAIFQSTLQRLPAHRRTHEQPKQPAPTVSDPTIPPNLYIIATMCYTSPLPSLEFTQLNRAFKFITIPPRFNDAWLQFTAKALRMDSAELLPVQRRIVALNDYISKHRAFGASYQLGHAFLTPPKELTHPREWLHNELEHQIPGVIAAIFDQHHRDETPRVIDIFKNG